MENKKFIQRLFPKPSEPLICLGVMIVVWRSLRAGEQWWFLFLAICALIAILECFSLLYNAEKSLKEGYSLEIKPELGLWIFYIIFAFYGFLSLREESFDSALRVLLIVMVSDIAVYLKNKIIDEEYTEETSDEYTKEISDSEKANIIIGAIAGAAVDSLYNGSWFGLLSGALGGAMAQGGRLFLISLKNRAKVESSNIFMPWYLGALDIIGSYLFVGFIFGFGEFRGDSEYYEYDY